MVILNIMETKRIIRETPPLGAVLEVDNKEVCLYPNKKFGFSFFFYENISLECHFADHFVQYFGLYLGRYIFVKDFI